MMKKWMAAMALLLCLTTALCAAGADGYSQLAGSEVSFASYTGWYDQYINADNFGWVTEGSPAYVVSRNASLWQDARTNSKKLASVGNGETVQVVLDAGGNAVMQNGFYNVTYKGKTGWINSAYVVYKPLEIVLMESNVPAYCAPSTQAKRVGSLSKLTRYRVLGFYHDYYVIALRQAAAFIPMDVAHYDSAYEAMHTRHASAVTTAKLTLRTGPGDGYASVKDLKAGEAITVYDVVDGWYLMVEHSNDGEAYVYAPGDSVRVTSEWLSQ